jgi:3-hydroxyacyl-CoA dehydrogenase
LLVSLVLFLVNQFNSKAMVVFIIDMSKADTKNPLNPLGRKLRQLLLHNLDQAERDDTVTSVIITGGGKNFSAGADLTEFGSLSTTTAAIAGTSNGGGGDDDEPSFSLINVVERIENCSKPVVAAMSGVALGGGLEVALACHYRIAEATSQCGLPEVHVGVIPGAGGTQRLPRLIGVSAALDMILTGKTIPAKKALQLGLLDHLCTTTNTTGDSSSNSSSILMQEAQKWASWAEVMPLAGRRVGHKRIKESPIQLKQIFQYAALQLPAPSMGGQGMHAALKAVQACDKPLEHGRQVELDLFLQTLVGGQGKARRHGFFAIRMAQKPLPRNQPPKHHALLAKSYQQNKAAVIGAGLMGSGIALVLLQAGFQTVYLVDVYQASLDKGVAFLQGTIQSYVKRGRMSATKAAQLQAALVPTQRMQDLSSCGLVVEAVIENLAIKQKIFSALDDILPPDAILLSNTSTLSIDAMASALSPNRRANFAGWHFFSPAHVMKLVEIVVGQETSPATVGILQHLTKRIQKIGVVVGNCDGFVGNRMLIPYGAETNFLLEEGVATITSIDRSFLKFGIALGPFQMGDLAGLDINYNIRKERGYINPDGTPGPNRPERYTEIGDAMVRDLKRLGQKSGKVSAWMDGM